MSFDGPAWTAAYEMGVLLLLFDVHRAHGAAHVF